ncbi:MAG: hypothetical protein KME60_13480 [Cyanomargarita calcarea GSE-NOS-MK-12-04C]|jgi:hypothetical protein|uniref:Uncharacterized protein n=1 Tax=Cyanomargarita calcarea GSE-NOS-MK-12-04C TaxID=2839659 RepID=A0A951UV04_9CYAN|nr:hypothetical protein [Cyanomargarita calcarea GSE-NOS-MK-12-04C]
MFSRQELFEFFSNSYTPAQVVRALTELAKYDTSIDPEASEFPTEITEQLEGAFEITEAAVKEYRQIQESNLAQTQKMAVELASAKAQNLNPQIFNAMVEIVVEGAVSQAATLHQMQRAAFSGTMSHLNAQFLGEQRDLSVQQIEAMTKLLNEPEKLKQLLEEFDVKPIEQTELDLHTVINEETLDFDADEFLSEVATGKKPRIIPKTAKDTKALVKNLIKKASLRVAS